jgi:hypothetical protein
MLGYIASELESWVLDGTTVTDMVTVFEVLNPAVLFEKTYTGYVPGVFQVCDAVPAKPVAPPHTKPARATGTGSLHHAEK